MAAGLLSGLGKERACTKAAQLKGGTRRHSSVSRQQFSNRSAAAATSPRSFTSPVSGPKTRKIGAFLIDSDFE
jgi:hypothetical protein